MDISPTWAYCMEATKVILIGSFNESSKHLVGSNMYCIIGEKCVAAEMVLEGVYRCTATGQNPGMVNLFLTLDGNTPISPVFSFDYRATPGMQPYAVMKPLEDDTVNLSKMISQVQRRLAHLLFSTTNTISILSNIRYPSTLKKAQKFADLTSPLMDKEWRNLLEISGDDDASHVPGSEDLFELLLKNKLQEWLLNRVVEGCTITARDRHGQGAIHLCAILDYAWAVYLFSTSGLSLDFRDTYGWTALHWAAYYGREKMVAALLTSGANASLVTDSTAENPGGCMAADLASIRGHEGLAAYLAEEGLAAHMKAMALSGNIKSPILPTSKDAANYESLSEQELCLKDSLAAYRNAADAAARIQDALRERALKLQTRAVQMVEPEMEARQIVSALKIQNAYRKYTTRKMMKAAARIQSHYRTWQTRKNFLNMRRQAIRIQAVFRGHQARRQYCKVIWSVGVLEKAILRWRLKKKGLRGLKNEETEAMRAEKEQEDNAMEQDFFRIGREQAEDRMQRSVLKVQTIFRSYRAQQEYRRMKLAHQQAKLEFDLGGSIGFS
ncbi:calmodulin-binding transcription activator 6-like [Iris pallida]|uniref:Calmodulin-binding transcription activator 6-like n=1 Tax=Iris pallida TaxID=29817 RepID=A0AAX6DUZ4_IRIPA|nr:calmodulin-binding transcription activator 6-like [Iris pallida]